MWPEETIPTEIFYMILSHLQREDVKAFRLVCREFEEKSVGHFFSNVFVPFTADIFKGHGRSDGNRRNSIKAKLSEGMNIFHTFGSHIKRFGLSLELDEALLAHPPVKHLQTAELSFWGIYRWPNEAYTRYDQVRNLEDTADEIASFTEALRCLTNVQELALCCDPGLGYLNGPERKKRRSPAQPLLVLENPLHIDIQETAGWEMVEIYRTNEADNHATLHKTMDWDSVKILGANDDDNHAILQSMMLKAGVPAQDVDQAITLLGKTEGVRPADMKGLCTKGPYEGQEDPEFYENIHLDYPLVPRYLTQAQHELLRELDWAHRALTESYIGVIGDLGRAGHFELLTKLTIAKISSSHLVRLKHDEIWDSLPALNEVSLAVQPDWRSLNEDPYRPGSRAICPFKAIPAVYELLNNFLGRKKKIKTLHFEWICGGEFALGGNSRDRFILPAPLCLPADMVRPDVARDAIKYISLPHVQHLSLKNCYATPHLFMQVVREMSLQSLTKLELESFSLTGEPDTTVLGLVPSLPPTRIHDEKLPKLFTLAGFIEHFAPGGAALDDDTMYDSQSVDHFYNNAYTSLLGNPPLWSERVDGSYKLKTLSFKSCGYVAIDTPFIKSPRGANLARSDYAQSGLPEVYLQTMKEPLAGSIASDVGMAEKQFLAETFGMMYGWGTMYDQSVIDAAIADFGGAGLGRVTGTLERGCKVNTLLRG